MLSQRCNLTISYSSVLSIIESFTILVKSHCKDSFLYTAYLQVWKFNALLSEIKYI